MTVKEIITRADELKPNAFTEKQKLEWLGALEGRIAADVFLWEVVEIRQIKLQYPDALERELLVTWPHDDIYVYWLLAKIDEHNGEYDKYQDSMAIYNEHFGNFVRWFAHTYEPAQGYRRRYGTDGVL